MHLRPAVLVGDAALGVLMQQQLRQLRTGPVEDGVVERRQSGAVHQIGRAAQVEQRLEGGQVGALDGGVQRRPPVPRPKVEQGAAVDQRHEDGAGHGGRRRGDRGGQGEGRLPRGAHQVVVLGVVLSRGGRRRLVDKVRITAGQRLHHLLQVAGGDGREEAAALALLARGTCCEVGVLKW